MTICRDVAVYAYVGLTSPPYEITLSEHATRLSPPNGHGSVVIVLSTSFLRRHRTEHLAGHTRSLGSEDAQCRQGWSAARAGRAPTCRVLTPHERSWPRMHCCTLDEIDPYECLTHMIVRTTQEVWIPHGRCDRHGRVSSPGFPSRHDAEQLPGCLA